MPKSYMFSPERTLFESLNGTSFLVKQLGLSKYIQFNYCKEVTTVWNDGDIIIET